MLDHMGKAREEELGPKVAFLWLSVMGHYTTKFYDEEGKEGENI